jgi:hypothetical protein
MSKFTEPVIIDDQNLWNFTCLRTFLSHKYPEKLARFDKEFGNVHNCLPLTSLDQASKLEDIDVSPVSQENRTMVRGMRLLE